MLTVYSGYCVWIQCIVHRQIFFPCFYSADIENNKVLMCGLIGEAGQADLIVYGILGFQEDNIRQHQNYTSLSTGMSGNNLF